MLRMITALACIALTMAACADVTPATGKQAYCTVGTHESCNGMEGSGDCQPCPSREASSAR